MSDPLAVARTALAGAPVWLVGGAVRDRLLDRPTKDLDLAVRGDVEAAARALARSARAAVFPLSEEFGAWRVVGRDGGWQADLSPLGGETIEDDLALRDFTVNAIAEPLDGGEPVDPTGGISDLSARRLRMVSEQAFARDPLRVMRLPRFASSWGWRSIRARAPRRPPRRPACATSRRSGSSRSCAGSSGRPTPSTGWS